jgi:hypothetical protein
VEEKYLLDELEKHSGVEVVRINGSHPLLFLIGALSAPRLKLIPCGSWPLLSLLSRSWWLPDCLSLPQFYLLKDSFCRYNLIVHEGTIEPEILASV